MNQFPAVISLFHHIGSALRAFLGNRFVPADKIAFRISFAAIELAALPADFFQQAFPALRAGGINICQQGFGIPAVREIRAGQEFPETPHLVDHHCTALVTGDIADFVLDFNLFNFLFGDRQRFLETRIEFTKNLFPVGISLFDLFSECLDYVSTNINPSVMWDLMTKVLQSGITSRLGQENATLISQFRIPMDKNRSGKKPWSYETVNGDSVVFMSSKNFQESVEMLHEFIYGRYYPAK